MKENTWIESAVKHLESSQIESECKQDVKNLLLETKKLNSDEH